MEKKKFYIIAIILTVATILTFAFSSYSQPPPQRRPPRDGAEWFERVDANKNGAIEAEEYKSATAEIFKRLDRNSDGVIDEQERPRRPLPPDGRGRGQFPPVE